MSIIIFALYTQAFGVKLHEHYLHKMCTDFAHTFGHTGTALLELFPEYALNVAVLVSHLVATLSYAYVLHCNVI